MRFRRVRARRLLWRLLPHTHVAVGRREDLNRDAGLATFRCSRCSRYRSVIAEQIGPYAWSYGVPEGWRWRQ